MTTASRWFERAFEGARTVTSHAPGRVNLIGEHTDYSGGLVLPTAIPQRTRVELGVREGSYVRVASAQVDRSPHGYELGHEERSGTWLDYIQGVTQALRHAGFTIGGFDARFASEVPVGSGLSSSAALTVSLLRALRSAFLLSVDDVGLAKLAQRAENDLVGAPVGIMDPMAASLADTQTALLLDTRSLGFERVSLPKDAELVIIDSGVSHENRNGEYKMRRLECERAARLLGLPELRDATAADLGRIGQLPGPLDRRARHVVTENARVIHAVRAMKAGDLDALGQLFAASHRSMRDDYEVSVPQVDRLVEIATADRDIHGARLTGGGFGGAIVAFARAGRGADAAGRIARRAQGAVVLVPTPGHATCNL